VDVVKPLFLLGIGYGGSKRIRLALPGDRMLRRRHVEEVPEPADQALTHGIAFATADEVGDCIYRSLLSCRVV
jgi:hypothetical protein